MGGTSFCRRGRAAAAALPSLRPHPVRRRLERLAQRRAEGGGQAQRLQLLPLYQAEDEVRHSHWSGVYSRVDWEGIFKTTSVDSEPLGKQGQVLHSTQDRLLSVREYSGSRERDGDCWCGSCEKLNEV